jgi:sulfonate transport system substrate-binding protein
VLNENGLSAGDVEIIDMIPPNAKVAFELGQVDAWAVWPPFPQQEEVAGKGKSLSGSEIFIQSVVVARGKFIEQNPQIANDLLDVVNQAQEWVIENEVEAQEIVAEELNLDLEVVVKSWPKHDFNPVFDEEAKKDIESKADFLYEQGIIKNRVDIENLVEIK